MIVSRKIEGINSLLAALFLFQYSLIIPITQIIGNVAMIVAMSGVIILFVMLVYNKRFVINTKSFFVILSIVLLMFIKSLVDKTSLDVPVNFMMIALPPIIVYSYSINWEAYLKHCYVLSDITFWLLFIIPFATNVSYMRFGYGILPTVIFSFLYLLKNKEISLLKKCVKLAIFVISLIEMTLYGARGALVCFCLFVLVYIIAIVKSSKWIILGGLAAIVAVFNLESIISILEKIVNAFGVSSYALHKLKYMLSAGLEASSSGRFDLYREAIADIAENPFIGKTIQSFSSDELYVHNLFLQAGVDLGVLAMIILIFFVIYVFTLIRRKGIQNDYRLILAVIFSISCGRLMISSNLWERPEFWILLVITFKVPFISNKRL